MNESKKNNPTLVAAKTIVATIKLYPLLNLQNLKRTLLEVLVGSIFVSLDSIMHRWWMKSDIQTDIKKDSYIMAIYLKKTSRNYSFLYICPLCNCLVHQIQLLILNYKSDCFWWKNNNKNCKTCSNRSKNPWKYEFVVLELVVG